MFRSQSVSLLLVLYVTLAHAFFWEIVLLNKNELQFYNNGKLTHTEQISTQNSTISNIAYDPVHNYVYMAYKEYYYIYLSRFDVITKKIDLLARIHTNEPSIPTKDLTFDPLTETLFWVEYYFYNRHVVSSFSLKTRQYGLSLVSTENKPIRFIAVDSCGRYFYWMAKTAIYRARFDGSGREIVVDLYGTVDYTFAFTIDQQTNKMYWIEGVQQYRDHYKMSVKSADLNGQNSKTLYMHTYGSIEQMKVSNDFIYWSEKEHGTFWKIPKSAPHDSHVQPNKTIADIKTCQGCGFAVNYNIQANQSCEALESLLQTDNNSLICYNYCFQGDCSVSAEGQPKCRCNAGYSGERCRVKACHKYCLNEGVCSLNNKSEPVCQCTDHFAGRRCNVPVSAVKCLQTRSMFRDFLNTDVTLDTLGLEEESTCASTVVLNTAQDMKPLKSLPSPLPSLPHSSTTSNLS